VVVLAVSGGFIFEGRGYRFEISQINVFGVLLGLLLLSRRLLFKNPDPKVIEGRIWRLYRWGQMAGDKKLLWSLLFCGTVAFVSHLLRHWTFGTTFFDMSFLNPPLFHPFDGNFFNCSVCRNGTQFAEHILWSLVPLAVIMQFIQSDIVIFLFKTACLFVPIYYFLKHGPLKDRKETWFWVFILLMLSTPFKANFTWDFREDHFAFALIIFSALALYRGQFLVGMMLIMLTAATKENLPFSTLFWFVPLLFAKELLATRKQRMLMAGFVVVFSLIYLVLVNKVFIPHFMSGGESQNNILLRFPGIGNTMDEAIQNVIDRPFHFIGIFLSRLSIADTLKYLAFVMLPFSLGFKSWTWMVPALPQLAANLLVDHAQQRMMVNHYEMIILGFLFVALVFSVSSAERLKHDKAMLLSILLALSVAGRGPVVEITKRVAYKWHLIPAAIEMLGWEKLVTEPFAADAYTVTHFHRLKELRILEIPQHELAETEQERRMAFVEMNRSKAKYDQAKDSLDAKTFLVNLSLLGGRWFEALLREQGAVEIARVKDGRGEDFAVLMQVQRSPLAILCDQGLCQKPWSR
jgi:uncharacterized membrane protein